MPKDRYTDRELSMFADAAKAMERVMEQCDYRNLLYGKWSLLVDEIRQEHALRDKERAEMFVSPKHQLENLARWNVRHRWGFSDEDLRALESAIPSPPPAPEKDALQFRARVLEIHLPDGRDGTPGLLRTFRAFAAILAEEQGMKPFHLFDLWPKMKLTLAPGLAHEPGLRWRTIDFSYGWGELGPHCGRHCGFALRHLPPTLERPHAGLLAAAAHFPLWLKRMDGKRVPYAWLPGYELADIPHGLPSMRDRIVHHPRFTRVHSDGASMLYYGWDYLPNAQDAFPVYDEPKRLPEIKTDP